MEKILLYLQDLLLSLPAVILALSVHEMCHGYAALRLGDPTAKYMGRISMNPFRHLDPVGFVALLVLRIGWAKPVNVDPRYLKKPKRDMAIISLAGPLSNFLLAFLFSFVYCALIRLGISQGWLFSELYSSLLLVVFYIVGINISLGVFNLIPIPPLDGSKILYSFLPNEVIWRIQPYERYFSLGLILLFCFGILSAPIQNAVNFVQQLFFRLAEGVIF